MDSINVGCLVHQFQTQNNSEARAIRGVMIQKREALECIEDEMAQLAENKKGIEEDLVRLRVALAPHNDSLFPNEVFSHIFTLLALDHGTVNFPIQRENIPPQLVVSHVCSHWRRVALRTPELWSDTHLLYLRDQPDPLIRLLQRWLFRARSYPVTLSISFDESLDGDGLASALQNILLPIQVKRLSLGLTYKVFMALSTLQAALLGLSEIGLDLTFPNDLPSPENINTSDPHPLITRLLSLTLQGQSEAWVDPPHPSMPWSQLRSLTIGLDLDLGLIIGILRQIPKLEVLSLAIENVSVSEQLTMPSLWKLALNMDVANGTEVDKILRSFMCPSLTEFTFLLLPHCNWTCETFEILKQQYNMQELQDVQIVGDFSLPVSSFLRGAPMLRSLSLARNAIMDDEAVIGVSNGTLGRFLRKLDINIACDVGEVLGMVEARKKMVDRLIKKDCSWREETTILKDVVVRARGEKGYKDRVVALKKAGITIKFLLS